MGIVSSCCQVPQAKEPEVKTSVPCVMDKDSVCKALVAEKVREQPLYTYRAVPNMFIVTEALDDESYY